MDFYQPHSIYKDNNDVKEDLLKTEYYTLIGQEEATINDLPARINDDSKVYAKKIQKKDGTYKLMVKTSSNGKLYNPVAIIGQEKENAFLDRVCKSNEKFRTVKQKVFL